MKSTGVRALSIGQMKSAKRISLCVNGFENIVIFLGQFHRLYRRLTTIFSKPLTHKDILLALTSPPLITGGDVNPHQNSYLWITEIAILVGVGRQGSSTMQKHSQQSWWSCLDDTLLDRRCSTTIKDGYLRRRQCCSVYRVRSLFPVSPKSGISMFLLVISVNHTNTRFRVSFWILLTGKSAGSFLRLGCCFGYHVVMAFYKGNQSNTPTVRRILVNCIWTLGSPVW